MWSSKKKKSVICIKAQIWNVVYLDQIKYFCDHDLS